jgi:ribonuclease BN (tRNA processing enzyme)
VNRSLAACSEAWPLPRRAVNSEYAIALAQRASARQLALFHHDPWPTDAEIDAMVARHASAPVRVFAARDGLVVDLPLP